MAGSGFYYLGDEPQQESLLSPVFDAHQVVYDSNGHRVWRSKVLDIGEKKEFLQMEVGKLNRRIVDRANRGERVLGMSYSLCEENGEPFIRMSCVVRGKPYSWTPRSSKLPEDLKDELASLNDLSRRDKPKERVDRDYSFESLETRADSSDKLKGRTLMEMAEEYRKAMDENSQRVR